MKRVNASFSIPVLAVVVLGILPVPVSGRGGRWGIAGGILFYVGFSGALNNSIFGLRIHWLHTVALTFLLVCAIVTLLSRSRAVVPPEPLDRAPRWRRLRIASILLVGAAITIYAALYAVSRSAT